MLGGLNPKRLITTTPNWEYNAVMRAAMECKVAAAAASERGGGGGEGVEGRGTAMGVAMAAWRMRQAWPGPPDRVGLPMRCGDHKFEWTREEFRIWATRLAEEYKYDVRCVGGKDAVDCCDWAGLFPSFSKLQGIGA